MKKKHIDLRLAPVYLCRISVCGFRLLNLCLCARRDPLVMPLEELANDELLNLDVVCASLRQLRQAEPSLDKRIRSGTARKGRRLSALDALVARPLTVLRALDEDHLDLALVQLVADH